MLDWLYNIVGWVLIQIHTGLTSLGLDHDSGWAWGGAIVLLTVLMRLIMVPLFVKQMHTQRKMQEMQRRPGCPVSSGALSVVSSRCLLVRGTTNILRVVGFGETTDITHGNQDFPSDPTHRKPPCRDEVIDGTYAEAQCVCSFALGVEQFLYFLIHKTSV